MNLDYVHRIRDTVACQAVDMKWWTIPQLQVPFVEYTVPSGEDAEKVLADMQQRLVVNPNINVKLVVKGAQKRIKVEYRT